MKSSGGKEQVEVNHKYVFFTDPDIVAKRAERSSGIVENRLQDQCSGRPESGLIANSSVASNKNSIETFLACQPVQPYPFTFISAVKRKLAVAAYNETSKKFYNSGNPTLDNANVDASSRESLYHTISKMDFIKPLKVPDVKISPKTMECPSKDTTNVRDLACQKFSVTTALQKVEKASKSTDRAHRKLDFTLSEGHSLISSDDVESLTTPDLAISPSITKKKDHRDSSREKENRVKRIKKEDTSASKTDEACQECPKRTKISKHVSRKDVAEPKRSKNERSALHAPKDTEFTSNKPKIKSFATSTAKKDDEKRTRSSSIHSTKGWRDRSIESRGRTISSESLADRGPKSHEKIAVRDTSRGTDSDGSVMKYNDDYQILNALRQLEEQKHKSTIDSKPPKIVVRSSSQAIAQKSFDLSGKEQHKRLLDRTKASTSKSQCRVGGASSASETPENIDTVSDPNATKNRGVYAESALQSKNKNDLNVSPINTNVDSQNVTEASSSEIVLDPTKISFRDDSYSQQDEFCDLVTPDINLTLRSKRRKQVAAENDSDTDPKTPKHKQTSRLAETSANVGVPMLHPTALHMQFQAELHLFDSYNESLRQVMDVENSLYNVKHEKGKELLQKQRLANEEMKKQLSAMQAERDDAELVGGMWSLSDGNSNGKLTEDDVDQEAGRLEKTHDNQEDTQTESRKFNTRQKLDSKDGRSDVKVAEVQTQTANDIATQTETRTARHTVAERLKQYPGITYERGGSANCDIPELSLGSFDQFEDLDHIEDISLPSKMRTMSEISLHETTSSIKTETGTEISISTRDVTCSFNKYLDLEMAQLIKDEKLMYDKIEMLFKSREKTLNDRTRKLVKLEEQKRALRDTGQDSRISSVKKKQRALLLKLQQEKDEMNRLKELHKMASQERKLMLQKQRNMFNPQMSTKNILTKLKRSADCQSPRRLSGPMKGYDIRSNSSMSSLVDSDKSQLERSQLDAKLQQSDSSHRPDGKSLRSELESSAPDKLDESKNRKYMSVLEESASSTNNLDRLNDFASSFETPQKLESKTRKFEEKMPGSKTSYPLRPRHAATLSHGQIVEIGQGTKTATQNVDNTENPKSESDTLVEELSKKSKIHAADGNAQVSALLKDTDVGIVDAAAGENDSVNSRKSKASQVTEESLLVNYKGSKKPDKASPADREASKKSQHLHESKSVNKRKGSKSMKPKPTSNILTENILRSKANGNIVDEMTKPINKRTKSEKEMLPPEDNYQSSILEEIDLNESQNSLHALVKHSRAVKDKNYKLLRDIASEHETKENILTRNVMERGNDNRENNSRRDDGDLHNLGNISTRSQVSTFTISRHSSGDSEKSFSRSVVIRAQDHRFKTSKKLEQVLNAREAALTTRRNCVEDWIAWHTKLKAEENRVARMEQAAFKLVSTTANAIPYNDTTMSSDTSDVEGRVELLAEKLAERRAEMGKLKREARRQAKQRLKALEANLLNQIKKYDTTIHEMRKKLETQKTVIKESDKLAIESRSVADFKVPEMPLKRIQELYKSSDLLRSRSESDLIFSKASNDDVSRNAYASDSQDKSKDVVYKSSSSLDHKSSRVSKLSTTGEGRTIHSAESVLEEAKSFGYSEKRSEISSCRESQAASVSRSAESIASEDVGSSRNTGKSAVDGVESVVKQTTARSSDDSASGQISEAVHTSGPDASSKLFSRKLESLQLTNKNLNDDISTLENDLKALSEMMSHFSKKSDDKLKTGSSPVIEQDIATMIDSVAKSTGNDISEDFSKSEISNIAEDLEQPVSVKSIDSIPEQLAASSEAGDARDSEHSPENRSEELEVVASEVMSAIIPVVESCETNPTEEIDFEARSKEILNVIEQSIISEHVKSPGVEMDVDGAVLEKSMRDMHDENEALSQDINSLEGDIKSISKIISKMAESKRNIETATELSEAVFASEESQEPQEDALDRTATQGDNKTPVFPTKDASCELRGASPLQKSSITDENTLAESGTEIVSADKALDAKSVLDDSNAPEESAASLKFHVDEPESIAEDISDSQRDDELYNESSLASKKSSEASERAVDVEQDRSNASSLESSVSDNDEKGKETEAVSIGRITPDNDWTISDSFQVPDKPEDTVGSHWEESVQPDAGMTIEASDYSPINLSDDSREPVSFGDRRDDNTTADMDDVSVFVPRGESTTIGYRFDESAMDVTKSDSMHTDELDDILDIIARESKQTDESCRDTASRMVEAEDVAQTNIAESGDVRTTTCDRIVPRPTDLNLTAEVEPVLQKLTEILQGVERNIARRRKSGNDVDGNRETELALKTPETRDSMVLIEPTSESIVTSRASSIEAYKSEDPAPESESRALDDAAENVFGQKSEDVASPIVTARTEEDPEDIVQFTHESSARGDEEQPGLELNESADGKICEFDADRKSVPESVHKLVEKTFEIIRDPEYEDISEESLEVSEILDRSESQRSVGVHRSAKIPDKYESTQKSEDVLRILDEISQRSHGGSSFKQSEHVDDVQISVQVFGSVSPGVASRKIVGGNEKAGVSLRKIGESEDGARSLEIDGVSLNDDRVGDGLSLDVDEAKENHLDAAKEDQREEARRKLEQDGSSESSEGADTPRGVSEIEMDSPRDPNESRLDIDALDDDLLSGNDPARSEGDGKVDFHVAPVIATSEKDIEAMIDKLKASLEQPGLEVAELEAKLLRIEQLQIELEIKKLEAEEVSFYVREIPNKPPPPYTPPGGSRLLTPRASPTLPPAVVPSNVEELTAFTEKATVLIFNAKNAGEDIMSLQPPLELCELSKDSNEIAKQDRKIYNTFLFDLCKETIAELYRSEYEKPGPSWTKPNVKTKPAIKIPKTVEQLNEYVSKEVATLFGFKTKLQRENMVMRWSRKRRDRVDELLAREAQAEEDEWTKFHHDELAVKNDLTVAILDTLILETTNVVKAVYAKKRKVMV